MALNLHAQIAIDSDALAECAIKIIREDLVEDAEELARHFYFQWEKACRAIGALNIDGSFDDLSEAERNALVAVFETLISEGRILVNQEVEVESGAE